MFIYIYWIKCDFVFKKCIIFIKEGVNNFCNINDIRLMFISIMLYVGLILFICLLY